jgi:hypothetical protein
MIALPIISTIDIAALSYDRTSNRTDILWRVAPRVGVSARGANAGLMGAF